MCGAVFIVDEHEFPSGNWETEDDRAYWGHAVECPTCGNVTPGEWGTKLRTNIDEERFHKMMEEYIDGLLNK